MSMNKFGTFKIALTFAIALAATFVSDAVFAADPCCATQTASSSSKTSEGGAHTGIAKPALAANFIIPAGTPISFQFEKCQAVQFQSKISGKTWSAYATHGIIIYDGNALPYVTYTQDESFGGSMAQCESAQQELSAYAKNRNAVISASLDGEGITDVHEFVFNGNSSKSDLEFRANGTADLCIVEDFGCRDLVTYRAALIHSSVSTQSRSESI
jgi:hypothetical protein